MDEVSEETGLVSIPYRYSKNQERDGQDGDWYEFQFLIGILKTMLGVSRLFNSQRVSIPYRYSKNRG